MKYKKGLLYVQKKSSKAFLLALLVSVFVWILINLSKTYERTVDVQVVYENLVEGNFVKSNDSILSVKIQGTGFSLLKNKLKSLKFPIDTKNKENEWVWNLNDYQFKKLFPKSVSILSVSPQRISYNVKALARKRVPIESRIVVKTTVGYGIVEQQLAIDSIMIYGEKLSLDSIKKISTDSLFFDNVTENIKGNVSLNIDNYNVRLEQKIIEYKYRVEQYTQGDFQVAIQVKNIPKEKQITIFPKEVHVQFQAPLSLFSDYRAEAFRVYVDFDEINDSNILPIHFEYIPKGLRNVKVLKKSVTYLIIE